MHKIHCSQRPDESVVNLADDPIPSLPGAAGCIPCSGLPDAILDVHRNDSRSLHPACHHFAYLFCVKIETSYIAPLHLRVYPEAGASPILIPILAFQADRSRRRLAGLLYFIDSSGSRAAAFYSFGPSPGLLNLLVTRPFGLPFLLAHPCSQSSIFIGSSLLQVCCTLLTVHSAPRR